MRCRTKTAVFTVMVALVLASCGRKTPCEEPEEVVQTFYLSMSVGDAQMAYNLLSGADRRVLGERAKAASASGKGELEGKDMLVPGLVELDGSLTDARFDAVKVEVGDIESVEVTFNDGHAVRAPVIKEASCYRIPLGLE
jgi:hypothetical protein